MSQQGPNFFPSFCWSIWSICIILFTFLSNLAFSSFFLNYLKKKMLQANPSLICFLIWLQNALSLIISCLLPWLLSLFVIEDNSSSSSVAWGKWLAKQDSYSSCVVQANMFSELLLIFVSLFVLFLPSPSDLFFRGSAFILDSNWVPCYHFSKHHGLQFSIFFFFSFF